MGLLSWLSGKKQQILSVIPKRNTPSLSNDAVKQQVAVLNNVVLVWITHSVEVGQKSEKTGLRNLEKIIAKAIQKIEAANKELIAAAEQSASPVLRGEARNLSGHYTSAVELLRRVQQGRYSANTWTTLTTLHSQITQIGNKVQNYGQTPTIDQRIEGQKLLHTYQPELTRIQKSIGTKLMYVRNNYCKKTLTAAEKGQLVLIVRRLQETYHGFVKLYGQLQHVNHLRTPLQVEERIFRNSIQAIEERVTGFRTSDELRTTLENAVRYLNSLHGQLEEVSSSSQKAAA